MPADDRAPRGGGFPGFHHYADDAPRISEPDPSPSDVWSDEPGPRRPSASRWPLAAGAAAAVVAGLVVALSGQRHAPQPREARAPQIAEAVAPPMALEVAPPAPPAPPSPSGKLEVLPEAGPAHRLPWSPPVRAAPATPLVLALHAPARPLPAPAPPAQIAVAPPARDAVAQAPVDRCARAETRAQRMVCRDPDLAAADRRLKAAYADAIAASDAPDQLRLEQEDWMEIREQAAGMSRQAVESIYRQRTEELERLAAPN